MDYSRVIEPNYDPDKLHQPREIDSYIKSLREITLENWQNRKSLREDALNGDEFAERAKNIYYDTDNIMENQSEILRVCPDCSGVFKIDSASDRKGRVLAVHIPRNACGICSVIGREWYDAADLKKYDQAFLQDRPNDVFLSR